MTTEKSRLMFDFDATEDFKEDFAKFTTKSSLMDTAKKCTVEAVGTYFLASTVALSVARAGEFAPLAIGLSLAVMIYAFGHISGAHLNPAVTLAVFIRGRIDYLSAGAYIVAQLVGAFAGAAQQKEVLAALVPPEASGYPMKPSGVEYGTAFLLEVTYTFALAIVVLNVATVKKHATNSFYGLAIGLTVTAAALAAGSISGGAFNPAIGIALPAVHGVTDDFLLYLFGPLLGGALAGGFFRMTADAEELKELKRT
tara:strand:- start:2952 stop:3716 length:765 start_codon:yes stop_codon:yes gene_type:complete